MTTPQDGSATRGTLATEVWQCFCCGHTLEFAPEHKDVACLVMVSHLKRAHQLGPVDIVRQSMQLESAVKEYFGLDVAWRK